MPGAAEARAELDWVVRLISEVRTVRAEMNVPPVGEGAAAAAGRRAGDAGARPALARGDRPAGARRRRWSRCDGEVPRGAAQAVLDEATW